MVSYLSSSNNASVSYILLPLSGLALSNISNILALLCIYQEL